LSIYVRGFIEDIVSPLPCRLDFVSPKPARTAEGKAASCQATGEYWVKVHNSIRSYIRHAAQKCSYGRKKICFFVHLSDKIKTDTKERSDPQAGRHLWVAAHFVRDGYGESAKKRLYT
jgi:hypothetical protein